MTQHTPGDGSSIVFYSTCRLCGLTKFTPELNESGWPNGWPRHDLCPDCIQRSGPNWPVIGIVAGGLAFWIALIWRIT